MAPALPEAPAVRAWIAVSRPLAASPTSSPVASIASEARGAAEPTTELAAGAAEPTTELAAGAAEPTTELAAGAAEPVENATAETGAETAGAPESGTASDGPGGHADSAGQLVSNQFDGQGEG